MDLFTDNPNPDQQNFRQAMTSGLVDYFRSTNYGQEFEAEYKKKVVGEISSNTWLWIILGVILLVIVFPYLHLK